MFAVGPQDLGGTKKGVATLPSTGTSTHLPIYYTFYIILHVFTFERNMNASKQLRNEVSTLAPCELLRMSWQPQLRRMVCAGVAGDSESVIRLLCRVVRKPSMRIAMRNSKQYIWT